MSCFVLLGIGMSEFHRYKSLNQRLFSSSSFSNKLHIQMSVALRNREVNRERERNHIEMHHQVVYPKDD